MIVLSRAGEVALGVIGTILNVILLVIVTFSVVAVGNADPVELKQVF